MTLGKCSEETVDPCGVFLQKKDSGFNPAELDLLYLLCEFVQQRSLNTNVGPESISIPVFPHTFPT